MASIKLITISMAFLLALLGLCATLPLSTTHLCNLLLSCFKPPYIYLILNAIIISILASSKYHYSNDTPHETPPSLLPSHHTVMMMKSPPEVIASEPPVMEVKAVLVNGSDAVDEEVVKEIDNGMNTVQESTSTLLKSINSTEIPPEYLLFNEKPLLSARFTHRKPHKSNQQGGRALKVAKEKRHETLENTWKAIMEASGGGGLQTKKSRDMWDRTHHHHHPPLPSKLRKEPSLSSDELNRRAEAFIRNFNHQMRLQKQESLNQYMQMINRGAN
ncbi:hypothetical protein TanjilG_08009 [Lupinus angustifolius]|uniref:DUF4408 domain-containing protein n=1 Tax=Lupinus angustifolius TaxID=3871 RepID=A0A4P1RLF8_LUPAN|nr:PREDICTED: uncharacterized protein LOC109345634 [Lupinus angustifolius]OIW13667.1 hypothetical protein TanjilG_08009 [Lupinus angustifolius]